MIIGVIKTYTELLSSYQLDKILFNHEIPKIPIRNETGFYELDYLRKIFFPKIYHKSKKKLVNIFSEFYFYLEESFGEETTNNLFEKLYDIRENLKTDILMGYNNDPSITSYYQIIRSFPSFENILIHRFSHEAYNLGLIDYSRDLSKESHLRTSIDINPGAKIGKFFFIDHGTGVVIGETTKIGDFVRIYHNVTLGAFKFQIDETGNMIKNYKRHPTIGDNVVIGTGSTILGPISIGGNVKIGVNTTICENISKNTIVYTKNGLLYFKENKIK